MILELTDASAFDGPMPGIVDARGHLVREQPPLVDEELQGEHPDVIEIVGEAAREGERGLFEADRIRSGREAGRENRIAVEVLGERVGGELAAPAPNRDDGDLAIEIDERSVRLFEIVT